MTVIKAVKHAQRVVLHMFNHHFWLTIAPGFGMPLKGRPRKTF